jgi:Protein of unknown function (DUF3551)
VTELLSNVFCFANEAMRLRFRGDAIMRKTILKHTILTFAAMSAAAILTMATAGPAAAYDYPWCAQGRGVGIPGDCSYQSYGQCMASGSPSAARGTRVHPIATTDQPSSAS